MRRGKRKNVLAYTKDTKTTVTKVTISNKYLKLILFIKQQKCAKVLTTKARVEEGTSFLCKFRLKPEHPWWLQECPNTSDNWSQPVSIWDGEEGEEDNMNDDVYHDEDEDILTIRIVDKTKDETNSS